MNSPSMAALVDRMERRIEKYKKEGETERWHKEQRGKGVRKKRETQNPHQSIIALVNHFPKIVNKAHYPKKSLMRNNSFWLSVKEISWPKLCMFSHANDLIQIRIPNFFYSTLD